MSEAREKAVERLAAVLLAFYKGVEPNKLAATPESIERWGREYLAIDDRSSAPNHRAEAEHFRRLARECADAIGLVAVDPTLFAAVDEMRGSDVGSSRAAAEALAIFTKGLTPGDVFARLEIADAVIRQRGAKP